MTAMTRYIHGFNTGTNIIETTNHSLIEVKTYSTYAKQCKSSQETVVVDFTDPKGEPTTVNATKQKQYQTSLNAYLSIRRLI